MGAALFLAALHNPMIALGVAASLEKSATLAWDASPSAGVAGYRVYYGTASGNYTSNVEAGKFLMTNTIPGMANGMTHHFAVKAYNASGLECLLERDQFRAGHRHRQIMVAANGRLCSYVEKDALARIDVQATPDLKNWSIIGSATIRSRLVPSLSLTRTRRVSRSASTGCAIPSREAHDDR